MKRFSEQLKKRSERVHLRASERADLRERLVSYMEYHPLPKTEAEKNAAAYIRSESSALIQFGSAHIRGFIGAFAAVVLIVVPVVAERALPGDVLYPVKVHFNEELRSSLSVSPYAKVEWETERLERRIAEARLLASEGKLTEDVEAEVAEAVKVHSDAAQEGIAAIRETDSEEAAIAEITFESALSVQSEVLKGTLKKEIEASGGASSTPGHTVAGLAGAVEEARKNASEKRSDVLPSYEKLVARMESETTRAYELFTAIKSAASADEIADIERRLDDIEQKMVEAARIHIDADGSLDTTAALEAPSLPEVALLRIALSDTQKLISFMTDIDVRENVTIDALVPVTRTPEERLAEALARQEVLETELETVGAELLTEGGETLSDDIASAYALAVDHASSSRAALRDTAFEQATFHLTEAEVLLAKLMADIRLWNASSTKATTTPDSTTQADSATEPTSDEATTQ